MKKKQKSLEQIGYEAVDPKGHWDDVSSYSKKLYEKETTSIAKEVIKRQQLPPVGGAFGPCKPVKEVKKIEKEPTYSIEYVCKCRFCGDTVVECESGLELSRNGEALNHAIHKIWVNNQPPVPMLSMHKCWDGRFGIMDLIGQRVVRNE